LSDCLSRSDHRSPSFRKFYTVDEINELFAPAKESVSAVRDWLESAGIAGPRVSQSANKQWLQFDGDAEEVERLFGTEYYIYNDDVSGKSYLGCEKYVLISNSRQQY
jgi:tripeptidyl-peptidase-1